MANLSGQLIKGYELKERIGAGGFGAVYKAEQSTVGREVAVKVILPGYANQPDFIRRFEGEAQLIARLEHLHIVPLYDYWRDPNGAYLVMRWMRGGSLREMIINSGACDLERSGQILDQITSALSVAHRNNVIHRDLKPGNILLDEDSNAYLADFGIAKDLTQSNGGHTNPDAIVGSPDYLSPEQARSEPVTPATDVYSLGVVLYEMLTGEHPFPNLSAVERLYKHLTDPLPEIDSLDDNIRDAINAVIQKATAKDPKTRYADAIALASAFREAAALEQATSTDSVVEMLTRKEQEILHYIIEGRTNKEIADLLFVTVATVKWYNTQIYRKLHVRSRMQAIVRARELNLVVNPADSMAADSIRIPTEDFQPDNPYKGLRPFESADFKDFFGRERQVAKLLQRLNDSRFLAVVGPSGSGKSSLVKAGLIPAIWRGEIQNSEKWFVVEMVPGSRPLDELEVALTRIASTQTGNLHEQLQRDEFGLVRATNMILPDDGRELFLVIDQFEEMFTLIDDEAARTHFLQLLHAAVTERRSRIRVVITLRADFYDRPLHYANFGDLVRNNMETVLPLGAKELEAAIVGPAERVGMVFENGLVGSIIDDVHYQAGALPLLQFAMTELFERREGRMLTRAAYEEMGKTSGALAKRAEDLFREYDEEQQNLIQQIFLRLVTLGEGTEDTRRRTPHAELLSLSSQPDIIDDIVDTFVEYRLLSMDNDPATRRPMVEFAHEAIIREWERLSQWLNESRDDIRQERVLSQVADEWNQHNRDASYLLRGERLKQVEAWQQTTSLTQTSLELDFVAASLNQREAELLAERERQKREKQLEKRSQNFLRGLVAVFAVATILSGGFGVFALNARNGEAEARQEALTQASIGLAALAERELEGVDRELGVLLALEAVEHYPYTPQASGALASAVEEYRAFRILNPTEAMTRFATVATWSPDGERVALGAGPTPNSVVIMNTSTNSILLSANTHGELCSESRYWIYDLAWSPDGGRLAGIARTADSQERCGVVVLDTISGETLLTVTNYDSPARRLDWSSDGATLVTGHEDGVARLWNADSGVQELALNAPTSIIYDVAFSPDGSQIATASEDGIIRLWDVETDTEPSMLSGHAGAVRSVAWSPDGTRLVTGGDDALPRVWDVASGETHFVLAGHTDGIAIVTWSLNGRRFASQSFDGKVKVWDAATGGFIFEIVNSTPNPETKQGYVEFSPDGESILTGGTRVLGTHIWDTSVSNPILFGHKFGQEWGGWSPDGTMIATSGSEGSARLWDATTGQQLKEFNQGSWWGDWSPDGIHLVFGEGVGAAALNVWDISGEMQARLFVEDDEYGGHQFLTMDWSPDGTFVTAADIRPGSPQPLYIWDVETSELVSTLQTDDLCMLGWPRWSPDGTRIATGCIFVESGINTPARIWDVATGEAIMQLESDYGWTYRTVWSPDGTHLLTGHQDGVVMIWNVETGEPVLTFSEHQGVTGGEWSPDGVLIASTDYEEQIAKIWNSETGEELMSFYVPGAPLSIEWSPDGTHIIITGDSITEPIIKRVWRSTEELIDYAYECCVTRELTNEERQQFGLSVRDDE